MLSGLEVAEHNTRQSCWVIINEKAYDVTDFLDEHPGGAGIILKYAGKVSRHVATLQDARCEFRSLIMHRMQRRSMTLFTPLEQSRKILEKARPSAPV